MLQELRDKIQSWVAYIIVGLLILSFSLWGVSSYLHGGSSDSTVAKVNGTKISYRSFIDTYNQNQRIQQLQLGADYNSSPKLQNFLKQQTLQKMISNIATHDYLISSGFRVGVDQAEQAIFNLPTFMDNGQFSPAKYKQFLASNMMTDAQFVARFQNSLLSSQLQLGLTTSSFALPNEITDSLRLINQKRSAVYAIIDHSNTETAKVSSKEVQEYYDAHQEDYRLPEQVKAEYLLLSVKKIAKNIHVTAADLKAYYQQNMNKFSVPEQWLVNKYSVPYDAAVKGARDKAYKLASTITVDKIPANVSTKKSIAVQKNMVNAKAVAAIKAIAKGKSLSLPVDTNKAFVVYQVVSHTPEKIPAYDAVTKKVEAAYRSAAAQKKYTEMLDNLTNLTYEQPTSLAPAAKSLGLPIQVTPLFTKSGLSSGVAGNKAFVSAAFSEDVLVGDNNSDVIQLDNDSVAVLRIKQHNPATYQKLSSVKASIKSTLLTNKAKKSNLVFASKLKDEVTAGESLDALLKKANLTSVNTGLIDRFNKKLPQELVTAIFILPPVKGSIDALSLDDGRAIIYQIKKVAPGSSKLKSASEFSSYSDQQKQQASTIEYLLLTQGILADAKIKVNDKILNQS